MCEKKVLVHEVIDTSLVSGMSVREIERMDLAIRKARGIENAHVDKSVGLAAMYVWKNICRFRFTEDGTRMTFSRLHEVCEDARVRFSQQHIINYAAFTVVQEFYDYLCDKGLNTKGSEGFFRKLRTCFEDYQKAHKAFVEQEIWVVFLDHMTLSVDLVTHRRKKLELVVRDFLIQHRKELVSCGQKDDIALLQKIAVCLFFLTSMQHSFKDFFLDIIKTHGVDFSSEFRYAELGKMARNFVWLCEQLGVRFEKDKDGDTVLSGVDINASARISSAWNGIVDTLGDSELVDKAATKAFSYNHDANEVFQKELQAEEDKKIAEGVAMLKEKYGKG